MTFDSLMVIVHGLLRPLDNAGLLKSTKNIRISEVKFKDKVIYVQDSDIQNFFHL